MAATKADQVLLSRVVCSLDLLGNQLPALRSNDSSIVQPDASFLEKYNDMKVVIEGHCDDRGSEEYNIALGQNRAESLRKALVADGVAANRIRVISYVKEKPFCTEENEECWHQNRRDHLSWITRGGRDKRWPPRLRGRLALSI
jgi:peptidoglycan-associated lipoprotein